MKCIKLNCQATEIYAKNLCRKHYTQAWAKKTNYYKKWHSAHKQQRNLVSKIYKQNHKQETKDYDRTPKRRFSNLRYIAKSRQLGFSLKLKDYEKLLEKSCYYQCGNPLPVKAGGLDRINNDKGYHLNNVVPCCRNCNVLRMDQLSVDETLKVVKLLKKLRNTNNIWQS